ncbi:NTP transferase domain-containing protein [Litoribacter populi]|uniref:NTP transferase domain-containing protein n=1 Tax=Litoribacter populi TaxID=2598460 RepID=UPI00117F4DB3|nr:NTP transferase domain-containing protein [Litoribacter populi]
MKEIKQIIQAYQQAHSNGKKAVLATVVHIEGSSYRAPGARVLVAEDGSLTGAISGGCLEGDILRKALMVMTTGNPLLVTYDTSDEESNIITVNLGCNGIIRVLLEPIQEENPLNPIKLLEKAVHKRHKTILVTFFSTEDKKNQAQGTKLLFTPTGIFTDEERLPMRFPDLEPDIQNAWKQKHSIFVKYPPIGAGESVFNAFFEYIEPTPALIIAGAGNDVFPLVAIGETLGWEITIVDGRPMYANENRFPSCQLVLTEPSEAISKINIDEKTAFVLMSHNYDYDKAVLKSILHSPVKYIGLLGPTKKRDRMLEELAQEGIQLPEAMEIPENLYAPTGLQLGAETSEEIALSIIAEIQATFTENIGGPLRDLKGHIHHRKMGMVLSKKAYGVLLLAAGESKRLGSPKQAVPFKGSTLLQHAITQASTLKTAVTLAVISAGDETLFDLVEKTGAEMVENPDYKEGMASSIRAGVNHIMIHYPQLEYLMIMLCDQPYVESDHLQTLIDTQQKTGKKVVASLYEGRKGVPTLFHKSLFPQLLELQGDTGAKNLIEALGNEVISVAFPLAAFDVDTQEAKKRLEGGVKKITKDPH